MTVEIGRSNPGLLGRVGLNTLSGGWNSAAQLGLVTPLVVGVPPGVLTAPLVLRGLNSYCLFANVAVAVAGILVVGLKILRPDLTAWPAPDLVAGTASTATTGFKLVAMGSRGRDQTSDSTGWCSLLCQVNLFKTSFPPVTLSDVQLISMVRP